HDRHHDVEPFRRISGFIQMCEHNVGFGRQVAPGQLTAFERSLQSAQFVDQAKTDEKQADFGCLTQELFVLVISQAQFLACPADNTPQIPASSVSLVVTGPPELKPFDYARDNWIRYWFV